MKETGILIKSTNFHTNPYWVIKCDNLNLEGNRNGELPIDPASFNIHKYLLNIGLRVRFTLVQIGNIENYKWYAKLVV